MKSRVAASIAATALLATTAIVSLPNRADARSHAQCDAYARNYANQNYDTPGDPLTGAVVGGTVGSLVGLAFGGWGTGAVIGGALGSVDRAIAGTSRYNQLYSHAYNWCQRH